MNTEFKRIGFIEQLKQQKEAAEAEAKKVEAELRRRDELRSSEITHLKKIEEERERIAIEQSTLNMDQSAFPQFLEDLKKLTPNSNLWREKGWERDGLPSYVNDKYSVFLGLEWFRNPIEGLEIKKNWLGKIIPMVGCEDIMIPDDNYDSSDKNPGIYKVKLDLIIEANPRGDIWLFGANKYYLSSTQWKGNEQIQEDYLEEIYRYPRLQLQRHIHCRPQSYYDYNGGVTQPGPG